MSILNVWVSKTKALIGVDTDGVLGGTEHVEFSKLIPLVHANVVFASRGDREFLVELFSAFARNPIPVTFDVIEQHLTTVVAGIVVRWRGLGYIADYQFAIVGWSEVRGRMHAIWANGNTGDDGIDLDDVECRLAPWHDSLGRAPVTDSQEAMVAAAQGQAAWIRSQPGAAGGGRLIVAELTCDEMQIRSACNLTT